MFNNSNVNNVCAGGYYTIERKRTKLRLIALNTNLCASTGAADDDAAGQWAWLEGVLAKSKLQNETVSSFTYLGNTISIKMLVTELQYKVRLQN